MKRLLAISVAALLALGLTAPAFAAPPAQPKGCHGAATVAYKQATNDSGAQGTAIGGRGNSDSDPTNGQAHSDPGRGALVQAFLGAECGVGSQAP